MCKEEIEKTGAAAEEQGNTPAPARAGSITLDPPFTGNTGGDKDDPDYKDDEDPDKELPPPPGQGTGGYPLFPPKK